MLGAILQLKGQQQNFTAAHFIFALPIRMTKLLMQASSWRSWQTTTHERGLPREDVLSQEGGVGGLRHAQAGAQHLRLARQRLRQECRPQQRGISARWRLPADSAFNIADHMRLAQCKQNVIKGAIACARVAILQKDLLEGLPARLQQVCEGFRRSAALCCHASQSEDWECFQGIELVSAKAFREPAVLYAASDVSPIHWTANSPRIAESYCLLIVST